jgi:hypothetical protein
VGANHIKLMVDYCLKEPDILEKLETLSSLDIKTTIDLGYNPDAKDPELIWQGTIEHDRILLTCDYNTIKESKYAPCKHGGIMMIHHKQPTAEIVHAFLKTFLQSGKRKFAKHHFTHLRKDGIRITTHDKDPVIMTFDEYPNLRKIVAGI